MVDHKKTRTVAAVLERQGFSTSIIERKFDGGFRRRETDEPSVLVCGVDNPVARADLEDPGFPFVVEAGIGSKVTEWGPFAEHVAINHADENIVPLADAVSFTAAASLCCRFATSFRAVVDQGRLRAGEWVAVHG